MSNTNKDLKKIFKKPIKKAFKQLKYPVKLKGKKFKLYAASGQESHRAPTYFRFFARDSFYTSFLLNDKKYLKNLLEFCILTQGKKKDPLTGEGPGKIIHEYPEVWIGKRSTKYNASDTAALFLIGFRKYYELTKNKSFLRKNTQNITAALNYIIRHMRKGVFWDNPNAVHANKYALRATYWRDGGLVGRKNYRLAFPSSYLLLQAQLVDAFRSAAKISKPAKLPYSPEELNKKAEKSLATIFKDFWNKKSNLPIVAKDKKGPLKGIYSDMIHMLYYLNKTDVPPKKLKKLYQISKKLESPFGYLSYIPPKNTKKKSSWLWYDVVWPWEQAYIALAGKKFNNSRLIKNSKKVFIALNEIDTPFIEYFYIKKKNKKPIPYPSGCHLQLWSVAAVKRLLEI
jgi:glycogen debranching enzyme